MLKNYKKDLIILGIVFGLISYTVYIFAAEPIKPNSILEKYIKD